MGEVEGELSDAFAAAGVTGFLHAADVGSGAEVGVEPDAPVVTASVFKIPVLVELCRQFATGERAPADRLRVPAGGRTLGPTGLSVMLDDADLSLRDVAYLMMSVSDNHATDALMALLGREKINAGMAALGLTGTVLEEDCAGLFRIIESDGLDAVLDARTTNRSTPRETTTLLRRVWTADGLPEAACDEIRRILALQVWPHRLTSGFPDDDVRVSGKTGTLSHVRNEVGVVEYPDGGTYAVAVFLRLPGPEFRNPAADAVIGTAARIAVDHLRAAA
ncbi:serine hydrolase [Jiangella sp. DSM 45060]|uniref:serine hydrolase n=1 Tax=Jiangella sp. DSM 45060 TaxID=1798224 RepID=UPI00087BCB79|nr:serine hydrolase [Jiangella sp. DSM 45060]SDT48514.1 beta-lactamase class A [Jiangella sp. DSM 45060]